MMRKVLCLVFLLAVSSEAFAFHRGRGSAGSGCAGSAGSGCSGSAGQSFTYVPETARVMPTDDAPPVVPAGTTYAGTIRVGTAYSSTVRSNRVGVFQRLADRRADRRASRGGCS